MLPWVCQSSATRTRSENVGAGVTGGSSAVPALPAQTGLGSGGGGAVTIEKGAVQLIVQGDVSRDNVDRVNAAVDRAFHQLIVQMQGGRR